MRTVKLLLAVLLLPACVGLTVTAWHVGRSLLVATPTLTSPAGLAFVAGYMLWLVAFAVLPKPVRTYVLGHELTHAFWALVMGARVGGLRVGKAGGQVRTSKTNWFITLAPYFFPFYAVLFIVLFFLAHAVWGLDRYMPVLFFLVGLGWSFHVTFTLMMLLEVDQPDVKSQGVLFSVVVIYLMNLLTIALTIVPLSETVTLAGLVRMAGADLWNAYGWTLDKLVGLWQHAARFSRDTQ